MPNPDKFGFGNVRLMDQEPFDVHLGQWIELNELTAMLTPCGCSNAQNEGFANAQNEGKMRFFYQVIRCQQSMSKNWLGAECTQYSELSVIILGELPPRDT